MNEKIKLALLVIPLVVLVGYSWVFVTPYYSEDDVLERAPGPVVLGTIWAVGITIASVLIVRMQYRTVRAGLPLNDERSKTIVVRAGYYSFLISVAWWLLLNAIVLSNTRAFGVPAQDQAAEALIGGLLALPVIFFLVWSYLAYSNRPSSG